MSEENNYKLIDSTKEKPLVSVAMLAYNHSRFISEALDSVLMQVTNFPFKIIIAEDKSTDNTREILLKYQTKFPEKFKIILQNINVGAQANNKDMLNNIEGKYIAALECDDYWTDPYKLQKQIDFLESNKDYSICFHNVGVKYENNIVPFLHNTNGKTEETTTIADLLRGNYIHTPSVVFRNHNDYPDWLLNAYPGDWPLHIINATYGKIKFLKDEMAMYRVHYGGVHSTTSGQIEKSFDTFNDIIRELEKRGLEREASIARIEYKKRYARYYGFSKSPNVNFSRFRKCKLILESGDPKLKAFFWLPLLFNNFSNQILKTVLSKIRR